MQGAATEVAAPAAQLILAPREQAFDWSKAFKASGAAAPAKPADPKRLGIGKCIVDTGCGHNLLEYSMVEKGGFRNDMVLMSDPVVLQTANGLSACKGNLKVATPSLDEGQFEALVMPHTPLSAIRGRKVSGSWVRLSLA